MKKIVETPDLYSLFGLDDDIDADQINWKRKDIARHKELETVKTIFCTPELRDIYDHKILLSYREEKSNEPYYWGLIFILAGKYRKAVDILTSIELNSEPDRLESVLVSIAVAYKDLEEYRDSIKYFKKALSMNADNIDGITALLEVLYIEEEFDELETYAVHAVELIQSALENQNSDLEYKKDLFRNLLKIFTYTEDEENGENALNSMLELDPDDVEILQIAASYYYEIEKYEAALTYLKKAENIDKDNYRTLIDLGFVFFELNLPGMAATYFRKADLLHKVEMNIRVLITKIDEIIKLNGQTVEEFIYLKQLEFSEEEINSDLVDASLLFFDNEKGFGFANPVDNPDFKVFIHYFAMENSDTDLNKGDILRIRYARKEDEYIAYWVRNSENLKSRDRMSEGTVKEIFSERNFGIIEFENESGEINQAIFFLNNLSGTLKGIIKPGVSVTFSLERKELDSGNTVYNATEVEPIS